MVQLQVTALRRCWMPLWLLVMCLGCRLGPASDSKDADQTGEINCGNPGDDAGARPETSMNYDGNIAGLDIDAPEEAVALVFRAQQFASRPVGDSCPNGDGLRYSDKLALWVEDGREVLSDTYLPAFVRATTSGSWKLRMVKVLDTCNSGTVSVSVVDDTDWSDETEPCERQALELTLGSDDSNVMTAKFPIAFQNSGILAAVLNILAGRSPSEENEVAAILIDAVWFAEVGAADIQEGQAVTIEVSLPRLCSPPTDVAVCGQMEDVVHMYKAYAFPKIGEFRELRLTGTLESAKIDFTGDESLRDCCR